MEEGGTQSDKKNWGASQSPIFLLSEVLAEPLWPTGSQTASVGKGDEQGPVPFGAALGLFLLLQVLTKPWVTDPGDLPIYPRQ